MIGSISEVISASMLRRDSRRQRAGQGAGRQTSAARLASRWSAWPVRARKTSSSVASWTAKRGDRGRRPGRPRRAARARRRRCRRWRRRARRRAGVAGDRARAERAPRPPRTRRRRRASGRARWPATLRLSSAGVPSATTRPPSMTATRSASRSASSRYCVVRKTVMPAPTSSAITSHIALAAARVEAGGRLVEEEHRGARDEARGEVQAPPHPARVGTDPAVGRRRRGRSARAARGARARASARDEAGEPAHHAQVLLAGLQLVDRRVLTGEADRAAHARGGPATTSWPATRARPAVRARSAWRGSGPSSSCPRRWARAARRRCPRGTRRSTPSSTRTVAVGLLEAGRLDRQVVLLIGTPFCV